MSTAQLRTNYNANLKRAERKNAQASAKKCLFPKEDFVRTIRNGLSNRDALRMPPLLACASRRPRIPPAEKICLRQNLWGPKFHLRHSTDKAFFRKLFVTISKQCRRRGALFSTMLTIKCTHHQSLTNISGDGLIVMGGKSVPGINVR